eukprot:COSAG01_NODE_2966_length_6790_cov_15.092662_7_plen_57_part_00
MSALKAGAAAPANGGGSPEAAGSPSPLARSKTAKRLVTHADVNKITLDDLHREAST